MSKTSREKRLRLVREAAESAELAMRLGSQVAMTPEFISSVGKLALGRRAGRKIAKQLGPGFGRWVHSEVLKIVEQRRSFRFLLRDIEPVGIDAAARRIVQDHLEKLDRRLNVIVRDLGPLCETSIYAAIRESQW